MLTHTVASKRTPRFLFRAWSSVSGGNPALNTPQAITPKAFHKGVGKASIHNYDRGELASLAEGHFNGALVDTPFSSWSGSLAFVLSLALGQGDAWISVIDTKKLLEHNVILHTTAMGFMGASFGDHYEFLAFGVITGPALVAVRSEQLLEAGATGIYKGAPFPYFQSLAFGGPTDVDNEPRGIRESLTVAQELGRHFGEDFALPIAVYLISMRHRSAADRTCIVEELGALTIPNEWAEDATIMRDAASTGGLQDTVRAILLLRTLVKEKLGVSDKAEIEMRKADVKTSLVTTEPKKASAMTDRVKKRYPRMLADLYIDMIGWEHIGRLA